MKTVLKSALTAPRHTPGPWFQGRKENGEAICFQRYDVHFWEGTETLEYQANLRLADAAPDLLAMIRKMYAIETNPAISAELAQLIAKAEGKQA